MRTVRFTQSTEARDEHDVVTYDDDSAAYFVNEGVAEYFEDDADDTPAGDVTPASADDPKAVDPKPAQRTFVSAKADATPADKGD